MKKMRIFCAVVFVFLATGLAYGHTEWAKYNMKCVPEDLNIGENLLEWNEDRQCYNINCCFCHGAHPGIPEGPGGCKNQ